MKQHLLEHFSEEGHNNFLENISITLIDKTDPSNPLQRKNYWKSTLKTMMAWGLNAEGCVSNSVLLYFYHWICTDCNKDLMYGKRFWSRLSLLFSSLSLLLQFLLLHCFYYYNLCDYISLLIILLILV